MATIVQLKREAEQSRSAVRLAELAEHPNRSVRQTVAGNRSSDEGTLAALLDDADETVRAFAAGNARDRPGLQPQMAASPDRGVRAILAHAYSDDHGHWLPYGIQRTLAADDAVEVRLRIAETTNYLDLFEALLVDPNPRVRGVCAANPRVSREQMELLITDRDATTRAIAVEAGRSYPDDEQLVRLARDRSAQVRWNVLFRAGRPREAIEVIADDQNEDNRRHARSMLAGDPHMTEIAIHSELVRREPAATGPTFEPAPAGY